MTTRESNLRQFVTVDGKSELVSHDSSAHEIYVAEVMSGSRMVDVDTDDRMCGERERNRTIVADLYIPLFCCRGPHRKPAPQTPEAALRTAAAKGQEGLHPGDRVMLNGREIML